MGQTPWSWPAWILLDSSWSRLTAYAFCVTGRCFWLVQEPAQLCDEIWIHQGLLIGWRLLVSVLIPIQPIKGVSTSCLPFSPFSPFMWWCWRRAQARLEHRQGLTGRHIVGRMNLGQRSLQGFFCMRRLGRFGVAVLLCLCFGYLC